MPFWEGSTGLPGHRPGSEVGPPYRGGGGFTLTRRQHLGGISSAEVHKTRLEMNVPLTMPEFLAAVNDLVMAGSTPPGISVPLGVTSKVDAESGTWQRGLASATITTDPIVGPLLVLNRKPGGPFGHMSQPHTLNLDDQGVTAAAGAITQFLGFYGS